MFDRLMEVFRRPVAWGAVILSYVGILGVTIYGTTTLQIEADRREAQFCQVIADVHDNAKFRAKTEQRRVEATSDYLRDPEVKRDALYRRISEQLPAAREDRRVAAEAVVATKPPHFCDLDNERGT